MEKIWKIKNRKYDDVITQLLFNRGVDVTNEKEVTQFLQPNFFSSMTDPYLLTDMDKAVERIKTAKENNEKVGIFADYDADGIPGAAFLAKTLDRLGIKYDTYIPSREAGYGLSDVGIDHLLQQKVDLIITVDLGIRSHKEARYCLEKNVDLIITDHHIPEAEIPECIAVINPKILNSRYPFSELSGAGVVYKLAHALSRYYPKEISESFLKWNLDLVTISTISDVVPLISDNRTFCHFGLQILKKSKNLGIKSLIDIAGIVPKDLQAYHVGFQIGPRINAPGRIDFATKSYQILITSDPEEASELAKWLDQKNLERQGSMDRVEKEATEIILKDHRSGEKIIIVKGVDWPKGVIGPTASRLADKFNRPIIVLTEIDGVLTGSARSLLGINIVNILEQSKEHVVKYGGHAGAAGLSLNVDQFEGFHKAIMSVADKISEEDLIPKVNVDMMLDFSKINIPLLDQLTQLEPFGMGNPRPIFVSRDVKVSSFREVGKDGKHISMFISNGKDEFKAIYFNCLQKKDIESLKDNKIDIVYNLSKDEWNGRCKPSLNIIDIKVKNA